MMDLHSTERSINDESDEDASEAQAQIIASLRAQVTDLFSQVTQLNGKLVSSYDRMSDLEDQLHDTSSQLRNASVSISSLELERSHHLAALNTGLLVEKAHVTTELTRLMERATEEAAQRGQAESARHDIEKDLDDLSASLFDQANTMVAEARFNEAKSIRKLQDAEQALKIAEDAVKDMQVQMQTLQAEKEAAERDAQEAKHTFVKGKWIERDDICIGEVPQIRFMTTHAPYAEFVAFVAHLRGLRPSQPVPPVISTLLNQPFLARLLTEDSEPTVRLDLAPSLNWLSRRSVLVAIHTGMLTVEPLPFSTFIQELQQHPQSAATASLSCALCGTPIARLPSATPVSRSQSTNGSWFKYPLVRSTSQNHSVPQSPDCEPPGQVYIFRLAAATTSLAPAPVHTSSVSMSAVGTSSLNAIASSRVLQSQTQNIPYPLCTSNYCLTRLRSTCSLWAFVRVGIMERIWEEEVDQPPKLIANGDTHETTLLHTTAGNQPSSGATSPSTGEKPPIPPRRRRLWEMASALSERAASWGKESGENVKEKEKGKENDGAKKLSVPPPSHPSIPHPHAESPTSRIGPQIPPPLPKRNIDCDTATVDTAIPLPARQNGIVSDVKGTEELATKVDDVGREIATADAAASSQAAQNGIAFSDAKETGEPTDNLRAHHYIDKTNEKTEFTTPIDEVMFAAPSSEGSPPSSSTSVSVATEPNAPSVQDRPPSPSPSSIPLPVTPTTPTPIQRVTSPTPRPRSRLSSPATPPPPGSRPASPALSRSRVGSPAPTGVTCAMPPSPGLPPSVSHIRGKMSISSPLAPARSSSPTPATGPGAPPLPRRAAARRAVPPPPPAPTGPKVCEEGTKEETLSAVTAPDQNAAQEGAKDKTTPSAAGDGTRDEMVSSDAHLVLGADARKTSEAEISEETKLRDDEREGTGAPDVGANGAAVTSTPTPAMKVLAESAKDVAVVTTNGAHSHVARVVNHMSTPAVSDMVPSQTAERDTTASVRTASTKQSSSTDVEGFATDGTWEERTWKELVRLKEAMFWARVGGTRAPGG